MDPQSRPMLARGVRIRNDPITGEPVLLFPEGVLPLDATAHDIISRCSGESTVESIVQSLAEEYEIGIDTVRGDVCECLVQLRDRMLIAIAQ
ncbi:MAG TPA: pyrroloquinoline quinone biosynthesis peptide chaperone PqqD [Candidatus Baltobacteraceae bacterium]|jgi:pyrroloquinoline quinone biosynthesis protein D|nr:pyrroloquinoline quinone biosynthesis peptide chaperone PqqD [Candidatus Baltobacteraceae bacterium]